MMIDTKTKQQKLVSRKKYLDARDKIRKHLQIIIDAERTIKVIRPIMVAWHLGNDKGEKQYDSYDKWLVEEFLQGKDEEHSSYHLYANMIVSSLKKELQEKYN